MELPLFSLMHNNQTATIRHRPCSRIVYALVSHALHTVCMYINLIDLWPTAAIESKYDTLTVWHPLWLGIYGKIMCRKLTNRFCCQIHHLNIRATVFG